MPRDVKEIRIFVASPGDVTEERDRVNHVVEGLNRTLGASRPVQLEVVRWETHAWPGFGADAQAVINDQIEPYDIFVGVLWRRIGTPTSRSVSGTVEEFQRAYDAWQVHRRPQMMFYFRDAPYTLTLEDIDQVRGVLQFKTLLRQKGALYWEYKNPDDFERQLRVHLYREVDRFVSHPGRTAQATPQGSAEAAGPSKALEYLLQHIPSAFRDTWTEMTWEGKGPSGGVSAGVTCYPNEGADEVRYYLCHNEAAMRRGYSFWLDPVMGIRFCDVHGASGQDQAYENADGRGRRYCWSLTDQVKLHWTHDSLRMWMEAARYDMDAEALYVWWASGAGGPVS